MNKNKTMSKITAYLLFDGRYRTDEDRAICLEVCDTLIEAKRNASDYGTDTVIVKGTIEDNIIIHSEIVN